MQPNQNKKQRNPTRERPKLFRALGRGRPPESIDVNYRAYHLVRVIKHDSWAATALYSSGSEESGHQIVCKFNRTQPIGWIPMKWLGRRLARRENQMYQRLADIDAIAEGYSEVTANGKKLSNASAHDFIEGHPLRWHDLVNDQFFDKLETLLLQLHSRQIAYVDMNKSENVIVNRKGDPCLIDFQISVCWNSFLSRWLLKILQRSDLYHCAKLKRRFRPDLCDEQAVSQKQPWWIRAHRKIANPFRACRRRLLVMLGIRKGKGKPQSEAFIEEALQGVKKDEHEKREDAGSRSADSIENKPILQLYRILRSRPYLERFGASHEDYVNHLLTHLFDNANLNHVDQNLRQRLTRIADHDKVVDLLKSKSFFVLSQGWQENWLRNKIAEIQAKLASDNLPLEKRIAA